MPDNYIVRTIFLQNYFTPAAEMAQQRREATNPETTNTNSLIASMKRSEMANQALERELNGFAEKGYEIVSIVPHPMNEHSHDLLITVILAETD